MVKKKTPTSPIPIAYIPLIRPSKRPTVEMHQFDGERIQETIIGVFKQFGYRAIDLDALIYFVLQKFDVAPGSYEFMHRTVRTHILNNFAIEQGAYRPYTDVNIRRILICYTIDECKE